MFSNATALLAWLLGGCSSPPEGIILVSIDTLRADALSVYGAPAGSSPFLEKFASEAVVFEHAYSQSNETLFSHASMFTSRRVTALGELTYDLTITDQTPSLAMQLQQAGLRTGAVVASGHLARIFGLDDGFDDYFEGPDWGSFQETLPLALNWLDRVIEDEEDFFLFLHSYDCHNPYTKPGVFGRMWKPGYVGPFLPMSSNALMYEKIYRNTVFPRFTLNLDENDAGVSILAPDVYRLLPLYAARTDVARIELGQEDLDYIRGLYATSVFYVDLYIGALMNELDRRGLLETTTIVIMSDHGEELLDHGFINHRHTLHDESTHVPLMVRLPGGQGGGMRHSEVVELTDVAPTIIDMVKGAVRPTTMGGSSLARCVFEGESCAVREVAYSEGVLQESTVTDGQYRLIVRGIPPSSSRYEQWVTEARAERLLLYDRLGPGGLY
ncbi:MAG: sulfatase, partial [Myxococcota bacterium]|nr:sulfatase [Myxococcota bacterium]